LYNKQEIEENYLKKKMHDEEMPFMMEKTTMINSELKYESWFIENPVS
jgi:hypothetical protein